MTTTIERFDVFDPAFMAALQLVSDPKQTVCRDIVKGEASGKFDLHNAVFPPSGIHRNDVPVRLRFKMEGYLTHQFHLMLLMYADTMSGPYSCLGLISHTEHERMRTVVTFPSDYIMQFIGIKYNPVIREGKIFIPKDTYHILELMHSADLQHIRDNALHDVQFGPVVSGD